MSTAARLRALVAALPEHERTLRWRVGGDDGCCVYTEAGDFWILGADTPIYGGREVAALVAALDPPVVLALADLLETVQGMAEDWDDSGMFSGDWARTVVAAALDLDAALNREPPQ